MLKFPNSCFQVIALLLLCACSGQESGHEQRTVETPPISGGQYRIPLLQNPSSLDPALVHDEYGLVVNQQIFEGLVRFDHHLITEPALARTWSVEEGGKLYRFTLRTDALFHDGSPVTTRDVAFSLERLLRIEPPSVLLPHLLMIRGAAEYRNGTAAAVEGIETPNEHTVSIRLIEPHIPFLVALGMYQAKIVPAAAVLRMGEEFVRNPIGSGPFRFVSWENDRQIVLERSKNYYASPAHLQRIVFRIYPGQDMDEILKHFVDRELEEMPGYASLREKLPPGTFFSLRRPALSLLYYGMRTDHPSLSSPLFRQALSLAIDRKELVETVYNNQFEPAVGILPPGLPGYSPPTRPLEGNLEKARELITMAFGGARPPALEIVSASKSAFAQAEMEYVKRRWAMLDVLVSLKYVTDWPQYQLYLQSDGAMVYRYSWTADMPDPDNFIAPLFSTGAASNLMRYTNPSVDESIRQDRGITDPVDRARKYGELEESILADSPILPLFYLNVDRIYQPYVRNIALNALGAQDTRLNQVWLDSPTN
jgi:ABC-type transport system substrate-binding protein